MKTFDGYKKRALSNDNVLLAGGGHKSITDLLNPLRDYVTSIGTSGTTLTWEKGGVAQTAITVPYAADAGTVNSIPAKRMGITYNFDFHNKTFKLGTLSTNGTCGQTTILNIYSGSGFNAYSYQHRFIRLIIREGNGTANNNGMHFSLSVENHLNGSIGTFYLKQNNSKECEIWASALQYTGYSFYEVLTYSGNTWTNACEAGTLPTSSIIAGTVYNILDSVNSSVSISGSTLSVKINGTTQSLTNTWRGITDIYNPTTADSNISLSQTGAKSLYNALLNGYASSAGISDWLTKHKLTTSDNLNLLNNDGYYYSADNDRPTNQNGYNSAILQVSGRQQSERHQLEFSSNTGRIYYRTNKLSTTWTSWNTIAFLSDLPSKSSWNYDDVYLKLSGGNITSNSSLPLSIGGGNNDYLHNIQLLPSKNWSGILFCGNDKTSAGRGTSAKSYWVGNNDGKFSITLNGSGNTTKSLYCDGTDWYVNTKKLYHEGNKPTKSDVGLGNVENTALSTWAGSSNLTICNQGTFGTMAVETASNYVKWSALGHTYYQVSFNRGTNDGWIYVGNFYGSNGGVLIEMDYTSHCSDIYGMCTMKMMLTARPYALTGYFSKNSAGGGGLYIYEGNESGYKYYYIYAYIGYFMQGQVRVANYGSFTWEGKTSSTPSIPSGGTLKFDNRTDSGYYVLNGDTKTKVLKSTDISDWAKANTKPTYTYSEVGAASSDHNHNGTYSYKHQDSWNFKTAHSSHYVTFDQDSPVGAPDTNWYNGFVTTHSNYLSSYIINVHRTHTWYVGWNQNSENPRWTQLITADNIGSQSVSTANTSTATTYLIASSISDNNSGLPAVGDRMQLFRTSANSNGAVGGDGHILGFTWTGTNSYGAQIYIDTDPTYNISIRQRDIGGNWIAWKQILTENNWSNWCAPADRGVWPIRTYGISLKPTTSWTDTGINSSTTYFPDGEGAYMLFLNPNFANYNDGWNPKYAGYFVQFTGTNGNETEELLLQAASHANYKRLFLRWVNTANTVGYRKLQIRSESNYTTSYTMAFKFRRII